MKNHLFMKFIELPCCGTVVDHRTGEEDTVLSLKEGRRHVIVVYSGDAIESSLCALDPLGFCTQEC